MGETDGYEEDKSCGNMLRNTPSNIRRLADEIQQCEGRTKYLAHTKSPSDGGDVRWYFRKVPMEKNGVFFSFISHFAKTLKTHVKPINFKIPLYKPSK